MKPVASPLHNPAAQHHPELRIGTAGWSIPRSCFESFEAPGSHLERYSAVFSCAEINSSFHRPHRASTYLRWANSTPDEFRFSVKVPKTITHNPTSSHSALLKEFVGEIRNLGDKLGPILFQLPPRQSFIEPHARALLASFRELYPSGRAALEPRNASWFTGESDHLLQEFHIARVIADPPQGSSNNEPGGCTSLIYHRLHGSPRVYYSSYPPESLATLAAQISEQRKAADVWCIFDNTASGAAVENALSLSEFVA